MTTYNHSILSMKVEAGVAVKLDVSNGGRGTVHREHEPPFPTLPLLSLWASQPLNQRWSIAACENFCIAKIPLLIFVFMLR